MLGERVWEACNAVFDRLPLAGVIDHDIFCVHGGIPRPLSESASRIQVGVCATASPWKWRSGEGEETTCKQYLVLERTEI